VIKKYYTLLIASEVNHINKSIRLSGASMAAVLIIITLIISFSIFGISTFFNLGADLDSANYRDMKVFRSNIIDIIDEQKILGQSDSLVLRNIKEVIYRGAASSLMIAPLDGFVSQGIDIENNHNGVDIISFKGDQIKSALTGIVVFSGYNGDLGKSLIISHPYNYFTVYSHCDSLLVKERELVKKGQYIATVGESGVATAPHLHFEVWYNNNIIDPREIIKKYGDLDVSKE